jgi:hypothetical protein
MKIFKLRIEIVSNWEDAELLSPLNARGKTV